MQNLLCISYHIIFLTSSVLAKASIILLFSASGTEEEYIFRRNSQPSLVLAPVINMAFIRSLGRLQGNKQNKTCKQKNKKKKKREDKNAHLRKEGRKVTK